MSYRVSFILPMLVVMLLHVSCRTVTEGYRPVSPTIDTRDALTRLESIIGSYSQWHSFSAKGRFGISGQDGEISASMQMRMLNNRYIYISLRGGMGIEGGKIYITPDSLFIIDKINKCYVADKMSTFTAGIPISLESLQNILLCRAFGIDTGKAAVHADDKGSIGASASDGNGTAFNFTFDCYNMLGSMSATKDGMPSLCSAGYDNYIETDAGGVIATTIAIITRLQGSDITMSARYEPSSIVWNATLNDNLSINHKYRCIDADMLIKQLSNDL